MKRTLLWLLALILFGACQKHESVGLKQDDLQPNNEYCVSEEDAVARALTAIAQVEGETASRADVTRRLKQIQRVRSSALTRSAEDIAELFYLVNFADDQGYALVAADERMTDVYMMSETGNLDLDKVDPQSGLSYFLERAVTYGHGELIDSLPTLPGFGNGEEMVDKNDSISGLFPEEFRGEWYHVYRQNEYIKHEAYLPTLWHQYYPYNALCPPIDGATPPAGCVAIAMGQIMAFHRHPNSAYNHTYDWDLMLASPSLGDWFDPATGAVSTLIYDICLAVDMNFNMGGSGAGITNALAGFEAFGYRSNGIEEYTFYRVNESLAANRPVFVRGESLSTGHAWVIDACHSMNYVAHYYSVGNVEFCFKITESTSDMYVHCNWGGENNESNTSWTLSQVFNYKNDRYNRNLQIIGRIAPLPVIQ